MIEKPPRTANSYLPGISRGRPLVLFLACLLVTNPVISATKDPASELITFVHEAVELIENEGEAAFPGLRVPETKWFEDDSYVFVWGLDGMRYVFPPDTTGEG